MKRFKMADHFRSSVVPLSTFLIVGFLQMLPVGDAAANTIVIQADGAGSVRANPATEATSFTWTGPNGGDSRSVLNLGDSWYGPAGATASGHSEFDGNLFTGGIRVEASGDDWRNGVLASARSSYVLRFEIDEPYDFELTWQFASDGERLGRGETHVSFGGRGLEPIWEAFDHYEGAGKRTVSFDGTLQPGDYGLFMETRTSVVYYDSDAHFGSVEYSLSLTPVNAVPDSSATALLLGLGLLGMAFLRRG